MLPSPRPCSGCVHHCDNAFGTRCDHPTAGGFKTLATSWKMCQGANYQPINLLKTVDVSYAANTQSPADRLPTEVQSPLFSGVPQSCDSESGITVGLIDSILTAAKVLRNRSLTDKGVREALKDLADDADLRRLLIVGQAERAADRIMGVAE